MKKYLCLVLVALTFQINAIEVLQNTHQIKTHVSEVVNVTLDNVIIAQDGLWVQHEGQILPVQSLEYNGASWEATISMTRCPNGHRRMCWECQGCGVTDCPYRCHCPA